MVHWLRVYKSIHEMLPKDKPSDAIIENDTRFDLWMEDYSKKMARMGRQQSDDRWKNAPKFEG